MNESFNYVHMLAELFLVLWKNVLDSTIKILSITWNLETLTPEIWKP